MDLNKEAVRTLTNLSLKLYSGRLNSRYILYWATWNSKQIEAFGVDLDNILLT